MKNKITYGALVAACALAATVTTSAFADTTMDATSSMMTTTAMGGSMNSSSMSMTASTRAEVVALIEQILGLMNQELTQLQSNQAMMSTTTTAMNMNASGGVMVGGAVMTPQLDIVQNALNADNVTTLVAAVKAAGLVSTLESAGPFTVFAPDDNAFAKLPGGTVSSLLLPANLSTLKDILTYHVVAGRYTSSDLYNGEVLTTVEGKTLTIGKSASGQITVNGTAMVEIPDIISSNGVTFLIDTVLMPPASN